MTDDELAEKIVSVWTAALNDMVKYRLSLLGVQAGLATGACGHAMHRITLHEAAQAAVHVFRNHKPGRNRR